MKCSQLIVSSNFAKIGTVRASSTVINLSIQNSGLQIDKITTMKQRIYRSIWGTLIKCVESTYIDVVRSHSPEDYTNLNAQW